MKVIELHIPDDLASVLPLQHSGLEKSIIDFLRSSYMKKTNYLSPEEQYQQAAIENKNLLQEFNAVDLEGWENDY